MVVATLDEKGKATYELVRPVALDEIEVSLEALKAVPNARALTFVRLPAVRLTTSTNWTGFST